MKITENGKRNDRHEIMKVYKFGYFYIILY